MLAVSYPPITTIDGLRISQASVTGQKVCHEGNHPNTTSLCATARTRVQAHHRALLAPVAHRPPLGQHRPVDRDEARLAAVDEQDLRRRGAIRRRPAQRRDKPGCRCGLQRTPAARICRVTAFMPAWSKEKRSFGTRWFALCALLPCSRSSPGAAAMDDAA